MSSQNKRIAFITGGNRGIGLETARELGAQGYHVVIGARSAANGAEAVKTLASERIEAEAVVYDAEQAGSEDGVRTFLEERYGKLDVLVNNAGMVDEPLGGNSVLNVSDAQLERTFAVNVFAVVRLTRALLPLIRRSDAGRIVNVSSILGSLALHAAPASPIGQAKPFAYNASKAALNAFTIHLAAELEGTPIKVNSIHPGWVKTALGGPHAPEEVAGSGKTSARYATLDASGPTGGFFHKDGAFPW